MIQPFLITGLPRSRTAWMATVCNTVPVAFCRHEPSMEWEMWRDCFGAWRAGTHPCVGISDPLLGFYLPEIVREIAPRVLVIERDVAAVERALRVIAPSAQAREFLDALEERLREARGLPGVLHVSFDALHDPDAVLLCLEHLLPGAVVDRAKVGELLHMNVRADMAYAMARAQRRVDDVAALFGADVMQMLKERV